ncbi:ABC transporter substrate-binding protein [Jiangella alba]|uniref:Extracellular solute-binding protein n=1 Tax=Jiangella alba TaxID=561176 RepID=A0A1H5PZ28_9ACTN|nr:extracellular solute-binding protein [Jiangella alba]SEF18247.1 extracellular solute-binding protein [Jiangella alba]
MSRTRRTLRWAAAASAVALTATGCNLVGSGEDDSGNDDASGENVTITVALVPDPPGASEFYRAQFDQFEEEHPDITVDVIENPTDQQLGAVELMFQQGDPPDVFRAQAEGFDRMYERGWTHSLEEFVTDDFIDRFPEGTMDPATSGLHRDGELYTLPLVTGKWDVRVLLYNEAVLRDNGYDGPPETWGELEEMATTITQNGGGSVFGYAPTDGKAIAVEILAQTAVPYSVVGDGIDFRTGQPATASPGMVEAVELHRRMQANSVMVPGWESWDGARAFTEFAAGTIAMYPSAPWHVAEIRKLNPEIELGIAALPVPDDGRGAYTPMKRSFQPIWSMSSETENPEQAWEVMDFLASEDFHRAYYEEFGTLTAVESAWADQAAENPDQSAILAVAEEGMRLVPNPTLASPGGAAIQQARAQRPELKHTDAAVDAIINNKPFLPIAEALDTQIQTFLDETLAGLSGTATIDDITFPGWDPLENFTPEQ